MAARTDLYDLGRLRLTSGEGRRLDLEVDLGGMVFGRDEYDAIPHPVPVRLDLSRTTGHGYALRLRFAAALRGPCMRCLSPAEPSTEVDALEVHQPGGGEELESPYIDGDEQLDLQQWARDAYALALPAQVLCRPDCAGLCPECGANLNDEPDHAHESGPDPRWSKLSELRFD